MRMFFVLVLLLNSYSINRNSVIFGHTQGIQFMVERNSVRLFRLGVIGVVFMNFRIKQNAVFNKTLNGC